MSIGQLTALDELDISHNRLTHLPDMLGSLTQLVTLNCVGNDIKVTFFFSLFAF